PVGDLPPYAWAGRNGNQRIGEAFSEVKKTGSPAHRLVIVDHPGRPATAFSTWIAPLRGSFAGLDLFLCSVRDVSDIHPVAETQMSERRIERLKQQVHRNAVRLKTLQDINTSVLKNGSLPGIFKRITEGVGKLVDHDLAGIYVFENDEKVLKPHTVSKLTPFSRRLGKLPLPFGEGIIGSAAVAGKTVMVNDAQQDPRSKYPAGMKPDIEHIIASPLRGRGSVYGVLVVARNRNPGFHEEDALVVQSFADAGNVAIENTRLYEELGLTGPSRRRKGRSNRRDGQPPAKPGAGREVRLSPDPEEIGPVI
ncbi:MAG TPA: GAF domain-containing protein, partial [Bacteroidota bacterium]|nr:GAF domain-containing protein [Bacteroidota bacterium]